MSINDVIPREEENPVPVILWRAEKNNSYSRITLLMYFCPGDNPERRPEVSNNCSWRVGRRDSCVPSSPIHWVGLLLQVVIAALVEERGRRSWRHFFSLLWTTRDWELVWLGRSSSSAPPPTIQPRCRQAPYRAWSRHPSVFRCRTTRTLLPYACTIWLRAIILGGKHNYYINNSIHRGRPLGTLIDLV